MITALVWLAYLSYGLVVNHAVEASGRKPSLFAAALSFGIPTACAILATIVANR